MSALSVFTAALRDGLEKSAATRSERLNTMLNPLNVAGSAGMNIANATGLVSSFRRPYTDEELHKINKKSWSNAIPGVAPWRLRRRYNTIGMTNKERHAEKGR
jgi:hypothetical protein